MREVMRSVCEAEPEVWKIDGMRTLAADYQIWNSEHNLNQSGTA
ncbi:hypothetical protein [Listeria booriae]|nr:hypothetical protein [Listeria booriae]